MKRYADTAIVLKRSDYGERDRILTLLTQEHGKIGVIAKGVRSAKSKMAAGIELLSESQIGVIEGKGALDTLTSSRIERHYGTIVKDIDRTMQAYDILKVVSKITEDGAGQEYYPIITATLTTLNDPASDRLLAQIWFDVQVLREAGNAPNLLTDASGKTLTQSATYRFDHEHQCFVQDDGGLFSVQHIKLLRVCESSSKPPKVTVTQEVVAQTSRLTRSLLELNVLS